VLACAPQALASSPVQEATGFSFGPLAIGGGFLVYARTVGEEEAGATSIMETPLGGGPARRVGTNAIRELGLASTGRWVVFARGVGRRAELVAVSHDGSRRVVLSHSIAAPLAARNERIAWVEASATRQRVIVRDMRSTRRWVAADLPRCVRGRCYRIDAVTLARGGVVFDRGAVGSFPSLVLRRRFDGDLERVVVARDPQPDLIPSASGAFYDAYGRGWMRWDFGRSRPHALHGLPAVGNVLALEPRGLFLLAGSRCRPRLVVRRVARAPFVAPAPVKAGTNSICASFSGFALAGRKLVLAWALAPAVNIAAHSDVGLVGRLAVYDLR
jgi:hypothetical protein